MILRNLYKGAMQQKTADILRLIQSFPEQKIFVKTRHFYRTEFSAPNPV